MIVDIEQIKKLCREKIELYENQIAQDSIAIYNQHDILSVDGMSVMCEELYSARFLVYFFKQIQKHETKEKMIEEIILTLANMPTDKKTNSIKDIILDFYYFMR